jgi:hypothetical protein
MQREPKALHHFRLHRKRRTLGGYALLVDASKGGELRLDEVFQRRACVIRTHEKIMRCAEPLDALVEHLQKSANVIMPARGL